MRDWVAARIVFATTAVAGVILFCTALIAVNYVDCKMYLYGHTHELGQFLGLAYRGSVTPFEIYDEKISWIPVLFFWLVRRILHIDMWVFGILLTPALVGLVGLAFDWGVGFDRRTKDNTYL